MYESEVKHNLLIKLKMDFLACTCASGDISNLTEIMETRQHTTCNVHLLQV